jgi:hypothetical protein
VILFSTDASKEFYDERAGKLFLKYGGGNWPSVILPNGFNSAIRFGDFGYGKLIIDEKGIVQSIGEYDIEKAVATIFANNAGK